jgi:hypothetical protein
LWSIKIFGSLFSLSGSSARSRLKFRSAAIEAKWISDSSVICKFLSMKRDSQLLILSVDSSLTLGKSFKLETGTTKEEMEISHMFEFRGDACAIGNELSQNVSGHQCIASIYRYNVSKKMWFTVSPCGKTRNFYSIAINNDVVFLFGGKLLDQDGFLKESWSFSFVTMKWQPIANIPEPVAGQCSTQHDGTVFLSGGMSDKAMKLSRFAFAYNVAKQSWQQLASMRYAVAFCGSTVVKNQLYVIGKLHSQAHNAIQRYDIEKNSWENFETILIPKPLHVVLLGLNRYIYLISYDIREKFLHVYDIRSSEWTDQTGIFEEQGCTIENIVTSAFWSAESALIILSKSKFYSMCMIKINSFQQHSQISFDHSMNSSMLIHSISLGLHVAAATASSTLVINGRDFGMLGSSGTFKVSESGCEMSTWNSDTSLICRVSEGIRYSLVASVSISNSRDAFYSNAILWLGEQNLVTAVRCHAQHDQNFDCFNVHSFSGSKLLFVVGRLLGTLDTTIRSNFDSTSAESTSWISESSLMTKVLISARNTSISLSVNQASRAHISTSFNHSSTCLEFIETNNYTMMSTSSSERFSIQGASLGLLDVSIRVRGGVSSCHTSSWISNSVMSCKITWLSMPFSQLKVSISPARSVYCFVGKKLPFLSVSALEMLDIIEMNRPTTGSLVHSILGSGFSSISATLKVRMRKTGCEYSSWFSFSSLSCKFSAPGSTPATVVVIVSIFATNFQKTANASSRLSLNFSSVEFLHLPSSGAFSLLFSGSGMATSSMCAKFGASAALSTLWFSDSAVLAKSGINLHLKGTKSVTVSCKETVSAVPSNIIVTRTHNISVVDNGFPNTGSLRLNLRVNSFGITMTSHAITLGLTRSEISIWESDSSLFEKPSHNFKKLLKVLTLTISCEIHSTPFSFYSSIQVASLFGTTLSSGSTLVYLVGNMFSKDDKSTIFRLENTGMSATNWISHSSSWCKLPATQRVQTQSIKMTQSTATIHPSSSRNQEHFAIQEIILTIRTGSSTVIMIPMSGDVSSRMRFGNSAIESTLWLSGTSITARLCAFTSSEVLHVVISSYRNCSFVGRGGPIVMIGNLTVLQHTASIQIATSSHNIMMQGSGLFLTDNSCKMRSGETAGESSDWVSDSSVRCKTCSANWYNNEGVVSFHGSVAKWTSLTFSPNRNSTSLWSLEVATGFLPTTGGVNMNILGNGWGAHDESLRCQLGFTSVIASVWKSDSSVKAKLSAGVGRVENLMVSLKTNVQQQQVRQLVTNFGIPEIFSLRAIDDGILFVQGSSMGSLEPKQLVSHKSVHHLKGLLLTELAVLRTLKVSESGRMIDFRMNIVMEQFSRLDGLIITLVSPTDVSFPLIRNKCKGCYKNRIQFQLSDNPSTKIPYSDCNDGDFRFDHFPVLRELLLESGDWKIFAAAGAERDFATISVQIDIHVQDYLGLLNAKDRSVFEMWNSDSGLSMIRGTFNARKLEPNIIISGQTGRNQAEPIVADYKPSLERVHCFHFPETGSGIMTIVGSDLAQSVFVGEKTWEGFDRASLSAVIKTGDTSCESSPWRSQSSVLCKTTGRPMVGDQSLAIAITIANAVATTWLEMPELGVL